MEPQCLTSEFAFQWVLTISLIVLLLALLLGFIFIKLKWLTLGGTVAAFFVGLLSMFSGSFLSLFTFFIIGTLASKLNKSITSDIKHSKPRDAYQVFANGGVAAILSLFLLMIIIAQGYISAETIIKYESEITRFNLLIPQLIFISISVAMADTLSSEVGMRFSKNAYHPLTFKLMKKGVSGAISWQGFLGGIFGSGILALITPGFYGIIIIGGIVGTKIDSLLGLFFQAKYENAEGELTDVPTTTLVSGFEWFTNDAVNFFSNLITVLIFGIWLY